ncbi:MAG: insulinase family protein [Candidatus Kapaibacterium sp.]|nr:MAG: insulinase family protein [Candidatus Kapabacteria bacterium]
MKILYFFRSLLLGAFFCLAPSVQAANTSTIAATETRTDSAGYKYLSVKNDPLNARIYKLSNGLTVYLSVNKAEPRVYTSIAVRAGSKSDPADATGLAHYLEHMLFKGSDTFGTTDYAKESIEIQKIEDLYEVYRKTTDTLERKRLYKIIDSVSGAASKLAIANEYDKLLGSMGAKGTNAYTWFEQTVYINDVPSNQLDKWLTVESNRFRKLVLRIFHTELEAVYEEKNIGMDNDQRTVWELVTEALFPNHNYGKQTTIGTVDHLKNPSMKLIREYFDKYYVPNNMAICLSGDFDPEQVIKSIDQKFSWMKAKPVQPYTFTPEPEAATPLVREYVGPDAESVTVGFRLPGEDSGKSHYVEMMSRLLYNNVAGLIDLNLNQQQKVLSANCMTWQLKDYAVQILAGRPKKGQTLDEVANMILEQIELVKQGKFDDKLPSAIVNNMNAEMIRNFEQNDGRVNEFVTAFIKGTEWETWVGTLEQMRKLTKKDIVEFANKNYGKNYVVVYKRTGERKAVAKVVKPPITPVETNRDTQSPFVKEILATPVSDMQPRFLDFSKDIQSSKLASGVPVFSLKNDENQYFRLFYLLDLGKQHDKKMALAMQYLQFLGTDKLSPEDLKKKLFALGCKFNVFVAQDQVYVVFEGLNQSFNEGVQLFEDLLKNAKPDAAALASLIDRQIKGKADAKKNKRVILSQAMSNYGIYGAMNPYRDQLSDAQLQAIKPEELIAKIKELTSFQHRVLYYGPMPQKELLATLDKLHKTPSAKDLKPVPTNKPYTYQDTKENTVLFVEYDMVQAEILLLTKSAPYNPAITPQVNVFNEYFGGGMSSIVFQTIRESKALAYSVFSTYRQPQRAQDPYLTYSYVGTQADKFNEAVTGMFDLLNNMPKAEKNFTQAKASIKNNLSTERIIRDNILFSYEDAQKLGLKDDIRKAIFEQSQKMSYEEMEKFYAEYIKNKPYTMLVLGSKKRIKTEDLAKYGKVTELSLEEVFGY